MTAVIGIINKAAAAIATDSAVTVTGPTGPKIFNRANKIFRLSKNHPVGLMLYNQGEFMGTPWEIIIKQYRKELNDKSFDTLDEYKEDFIKYLHNKSFYCDLQQQKTMLFWLIIDFLTILAKEVMNEQQGLILAHPPDIGVRIAQAVDLKIKKAVKDFEGLKDYSPEMIDFTEKEFEEFGFTGLPQAVSQVFNQSGIPINFTAVQSDLKRLTYLVLKSKKYFSFYSGLVFSGFGENEIFPRLISLNISIAINNRLRFYHDEKKSAVLTHQIPSAIRPYAQTDVIDTVLSGIDPGLGKLFFEQFDSFIKKNNEAIAQSVGLSDPKIAEIIRSIDTSKVTAGLQKYITQERNKHYIQPLMNAVSTLSKEDLAEMAESLIYLTYLKRRFTFAEESVGGPVDVAIITKGDGFIWIKRKHYFTKDLNLHFFKNY